MARRRNILQPHEWIALGAGLFLATGIYFLLIHPSLQQVGQEAQAEHERSEADRELTQLRLDYQQLQATIQQYRRRLKEVGGSPPLISQKDALIARVTALAGQSRVKVDQYAPIETVDQEDHQAVLLQFTGRGTPAAIQDYFRRLETEIDFIDVTHFVVSRLQKESAAECQVSWSCRINGMRPEAAPAKEKASGKVAVGELEKGGGA